MFKILKYLGECKAAVAAIMILLVLQAYCDLALPQYTADIVDVGIGQGGIENSVPQVMREETYQKIAVILPDKEKQLFWDAYEKNEDGNYELILKKKEEIDNLDSILKEPLAGLLVIQQMASSKEQVDSSASMAAFSDPSISDTMITQMSVAFVKAEYEAMGMDIGKVQTDYLLKKGSIMLGFSVLMMAAAICVGYFAAKSSAKIGMNLRQRVFHKVVSFSNTEMDQFSTASLITRNTNDIQQVQMVAVMMLRMVLYAPIIGIGGVIKVASTKTGMGWIVGVAVGAIMLLVLTLMVIAMPKFKQMQVLVDKLNLVSREILTGIPVIRAFSRERYEEKRFNKANKELMDTQLFTNRVMTFMMPAMMLIMNGISILIVWYGAKGVDLGNMQVGDMLAFITYTMQIVMAFLMITMISIMLPRAGVAATRIEEVIKMENSIHDKEVTEDGKVEAPTAEVVFDHVSFRYPGADEDALTDITFHANPGETTAIIGSTGCGKSTLVQLIPRFYDVTEGTITVNGVDIRELSQHKLHSLIGYVPQKAVLFSGTIESNIKFGGEFITEDDMEEAGRIAQATEFIESKPDRYQSDISQGGTNVSGGQKQRLSIARAIAMHPKICIFDDSFSALDYKTDVILRKALKEKLTQATVIIVAQRISTILHADRIIVLDDGKIAGMGRHDELLKNCEAYQEIAKSQLSESELKGGMA